MKETEELVPSTISVSQICLFRKGSDIDLQVSLQRSRAESQHTIAHIGKDGYGLTINLA